jgi:perosamine synthetase
MGEDTAATFEPGTRIAGFIPLCVPEVRGREWDYIKECLDTGWVSSVGSYVDRFERELAARTGAGHAVATATGTAALHVSLLVAGVRPDDEVLVSTLTFIAPANAVRYAGAWPVFIDAEPGYWQIDPQRVVDFLENSCRWSEGGLYNKVTGRRIGAILPVDVLGHPADLDPILEAARKYGIPVVEDATESLGALYRGRPAGMLGDIGCFSFNGNKLITTGGGGMIVTNNAAWADKARYLTTQAKDDPVEYVHGQVGYNYRLTNIQAAMGCAQLERLDEYAAAKRSIAARYQEALGRIEGLTVMPFAPWARAVFWMYTVLIDEELYGHSSRRLLARLFEKRIQARPLWQPLHRSAAHPGAQACQSGVADRLNRDALSLPCSAGLSAADQETVIQAVAEFSRSGR